MVIPVHGLSGPKNLFRKGEQMHNEFKGFLAAITLAASVTSQASTVTYDFTGTINSATGTYSAAGSTVSGTIAIDLAAANPSQSSGTLGSTSATWNEEVYGGSEFGTPVPTAPVYNISINSGAVSYSSAPASALSQTSVSGSFVNGVPSEWIAEEVEVSSESESGNTFIQNGLGLVGAASPVPWGSNGLPILGNATGQSNYLWDYVGGTEVGALSYTITSLTPVPLPTTAWLMLSGMVGLGAMARRRKAKNSVPML
jgi:hypothetical protein